MSEYKHSSDRWLSEGKPSVTSQSEGLGTAMHRSRRIVGIISTLERNQSVDTDDLAFVENVLCMIPPLSEAPSKDERKWKTMQYALFANCTLLFPVIATQFVPGVTMQLCTKVRFEKDSDGALGLVEPLSRIVELRLLPVGDRAVAALEHACAEALSAKSTQSPYSEAGKSARGRLFQLWGLVLGQYSGDFPVPTAQRMYSSCLYAIRTEWPRRSSGEAPKSWSALDGMVRGLTSMLQSYPSIPVTVGQVRSLTPDTHIPANELATIAQAALSLLPKLQTRTSPSLFVACTELLTLHACGVFKDAILPSLVQLWDTVLANCQAKQKKVAKASPAALIALTKLCAMDLRDKLTNAPSPQSTLYKAIVRERLFPMLRGEKDPGEEEPKSSTTMARLQLALRCLPIVAFAIIRYEGEETAVSTARHMLQQASDLARQAPKPELLDPDDKDSISEDIGTDTEQLQPGDVEDEAISASPSPETAGHSAVEAEAPPAQYLSVTSLGRLLASALAGSAAVISHALTSIEAAAGLLPLLQTCLVDLFRLWPYLDEKPAGGRALAANAVAMVLASVHRLTQSQTSSAVLQSFVSTFTRALWTTTFGRLHVSATAASVRWIHPVTGEMDSRAIWVYAPLWIELCNFEDPASREAVAEMAIGLSSALPSLSAFGQGLSNDWNGPSDRTSDSPLPALSDMICSGFMTLLIEHLGSWDLSLLAVGEVAEDTLGSQGASTIVDDQSGTLQSMLTGQAAVLSLSTLDANTQASHVQPADPMAYDHFLSCADLVRYALPHLPLHVTSRWTGQVLKACTRLAVAYPHAHGLWSIGACFMLTSQLNAVHSHAEAPTGSNSTGSSSQASKESRDSELAVAQDNFFHSAAQQMHQVRGSAQLSVLQAMACMPISYLEQFTHFYVDAAEAALNAGLDEPVLAMEALKLLDALRSMHASDLQPALSRLWPRLLLLLRSCSAQAKQTSDVPPASSREAETDEAYGDDEEEAHDLERSIFASRGFRQQVEAMTCVLTDEVVTILAPSIRATWAAGYGVDLTGSSVRGGLVERLRDLQPHNVARYSTSVVLQSTQAPSAEIPPSSVNLFSDPGQARARTRTLACLATLRASEAKVSTHDVVVAAASLLGRLGSVSEALLPTSTSALADHMGRAAGAVTNGKGLVANLHLASLSHQPSGLSITMSLNKYAFALCDIAESSPAALTRAAASEALHAILCAAMGQACFTGHDTHWDLLVRCLGSLVRLSNQENDVSTALFGSLVDQLMLLYGSDPRIASGTRGDQAAVEKADKRRADMLDVLFNLMVGHDSTVAVRSGRALGSYVMACLRATSVHAQAEEQCNTMPTGANRAETADAATVPVGSMIHRVRPAMNRLCAAARHPSPSARLAACVAWSAVYKTYRERRSVVSATLLELLDAFMTCLRLSSRDGSSTASEAAASAAVDHAMRILLHPVHASLFTGPDTLRSRGSPTTLHQLAAWLYLQCSVPDTSARRKSMLILERLCEQPQDQRPQHGHASSATSSLQSKSLQQWVADLCSDTGSPASGMHELLQMKGLAPHAHMSAKRPHATGAGKEHPHLDDPHDEADIAALQTQGIVVTLPHVVPGDRYECTIGLITFPLRYFSPDASSLDAAVVAAYTRALAVAVDVASWAVNRKVIAPSELFFALSGVKRKRAATDVGHSGSMAAHLYVAIDLLSSPLAGHEGRRDRCLLFCRLLALFDCAVSGIPADMSRRLRVLVCSALESPASLSLEDATSTAGSDTYLRSAIAASVRTHHMASEITEHMEQSGVHLSALAGSIALADIASVVSLHSIASILAEAGALEEVLKLSASGDSSQWAVTVADAIRCCQNPPPSVQLVLASLLQLVLNVLPLSRAQIGSNTGGSESLDLFRALGMQYPATGNKLLQQYQHVVVLHVMTALQRPAQQRPNEAAQNSSLLFFRRLAELIADSHCSVNATELLVVICDAVVAALTSGTSASPRPALGSTLVPGLVTILEHAALLSGPALHTCVAAILHCMVIVDPWLLVNDRQVGEASFPMRALPASAEGALCKWMEGERKPLSLHKGLSDHIKTITHFLPYFLPGFSSVSPLPAEVVSVASLHLPELSDAMGGGRQRQLNGSHQVALAFLSSIISDFPSSSSDLIDSVDAQSYSAALTLLCQCVVRSGSVHAFRRLLPVVREGRKSRFYSLLAGTLQALAATIPIQGPSFNVWATEILLTCFADGSGDFTPGLGTGGLYFAPLLEVAPLIPLLVDNLLVPMIARASEQALQLLLTDRQFFRQLVTASGVVEGGAFLSGAGSHSCLLAYLLATAAMHQEQASLQLLSAALVLARRTAAFSILAALFHQYGLRAVATGSVEQRREKLKREYGHQAQGGSAGGGNSDLDKLLFRDIQDACAILLRSQPALKGTPVVQQRDLHRMHQVAYVALAAGTQLTQNKVAAHSAVLFSHTGKYAIDWSRIWPEASDDGKGIPYLPGIGEPVRRVKYDLSRLVTAQLDDRVSYVAARILESAKTSHNSPTVPMAVGNTRNGTESLSIASLSALQGMRPVQEGHEKNDDTATYPDIQAEGPAAFAAARGSSLSFASLSDTPSLQTPRGKELPADSEPVPVYQQSSNAAIWTLDALTSSPSFLAMLREIDVLGKLEADLDPTTGMPKWMAQLYQWASQPQEASAQTRTVPHRLVVARLILQRPGIFQPHQALWCPLLLSVVLDCYRVADLQGEATTIMKNKDTYISFMKEVVHLIAHLWAQESSGSVYIPATDDQKRICTRFLERLLWCSITTRSSLLEEHKGDLGKLIMPWERACVRVSRFKIMKLLATAMPATGHQSKLSRKAAARIQLAGAYLAYCHAASVPCYDDEHSRPSLGENAFSLRDFLARVASLLPGAIRSAAYKVYSVVLGMGLAQGKATNEDGQLVRDIVSPSLARLFSAIASSSSSATNERGYLRYLVCLGGVAYYYPRIVGKEELAVCRTIMLHTKGRSYLRGDELASLLSILSGYLRGAKAEGLHAQKQQAAREIWAVLDGEQALSDLLSARASTRVRGATVQQQALELIAELVAEDGLPSTALADLFDSQRPYCLPSMFNAHAHAGARLAFHEVCQAVLTRAHGSSSSQASETAQGAARLALFKALGHSESVIKAKAYRFWNEGSYMPSGDVTQRLQVLLSTFTPETSADWLLYATPLLLATARSLPQYTDKALINKEAITDVLVPAPLYEGNAGGPTSSLKPRFAQMIAQGLTQGKVTIGGRRGGQQLASQIAGPLFSQTMKGGAAGSVTNDVSSMLSFLPVPLNRAQSATDQVIKPAALGMAKVYGILARGTLPEGQERITSLQASQSEALQAASSSRPAAAPQLELPSLIFSSTQQVRASGQPSSNVSRRNTIRSYSVGALPDVQMSLSDIFGPIQTLCEHDSSMADLVFSDITKGIMQCLFVGMQQEPNKGSAANDRATASAGRAEPYALAPGIQQPDHSGRPRGYLDGNDVDVRHRTAYADIRSALMGIARQLGMKAGFTTIGDGTGVLLVQSVQALLSFTSHLSSQLQISGRLPAASSSAQSTSLVPAFPLPPHLLLKHATVHQSHASSVQFLLDGMLRSGRFPGSQGAAVFAPFVTGMPTIPAGAGSTLTPLPSNASGFSLAIVCREIEAQRSYTVDAETVKQAWAALQDLYSSLGEEDAMMGAAHMRGEIARLTALHHGSNSLVEESGTPTAMDEDVTLHEHASDPVLGIELELSGRLHAAMDLYTSTPQDDDAQWDKLRCLIALEHWPQAYTLVDQLCPVETFPAWVAAGPPSHRVDLIERASFHLCMAQHMGSNVAGRLVSKQGLLPADDTDLCSLDLTTASRAALQRLSTLHAAGAHAGIGAVTSAMLHALVQDGKGAANSISRARIACSSCQITSASQVATLSTLATSARSEAMRRLVPLAEWADWLGVASSAAVVVQAAKGSQAASRASATLSVSLVPMLHECLHRQTGGGCLAPVQSALVWDTLLCTRTATAVHAESLISKLPGCHGSQRWMQALSRRLHAAAAPSLLEAGGTELCIGWARRLLRMPQDIGQELSPETARNAEVLLGKLYVENSSLAVSDRCVAIRSAISRLSMAGKAGSDTLERHLKALQSDISDFTIQAQSKGAAGFLNVVAIRHALAAYVGFGRQVTLGEAFLARSTHAILHNCQAAGHVQCTYVKGEGHAYGPSQTQALQQLSACIEGTLQKGGPGSMLASAGVEVHGQEDEDDEPQSVLSALQQAGMPCAMLSTHSAQLTRARLLLASYFAMLLRLEEEGHSKVTQPALSELAAMASKAGDNNCQSVSNPGVVAAWLTKLVLQAAGEPSTYVTSPPSQALPGHLLQLYASLDDCGVSTKHDTFIRSPSVLLPRVIELCSQYPAAQQQLHAVVAQGKGERAHGPPLYVWLPCIQHLFASLQVVSKNSTSAASSGATFSCLLSSLARVYPHSVYYPYRMALATARPTAVERIWDVKSDSRQPDSSTALAAALGRVGASLGPLVPLLDAWTIGLEELQPIKMRFQDWLVDKCGHLIQHARAKKLSRVPQNCSKWLLEEFTSYFIEPSGQLRALGSLAVRFWQKYNSRIMAACQTSQGVSFTEETSKLLFAILNEPAMEEYSVYTDVSQASTWLASFRGYDQPPGFDIEVPGQYDAADGTRAPQVELHSRLSYVNPSLTVMASMRRPVRFTVVSHDERVHPFLAKAGEDLRTDARVESLFTAAAQLWSESQVGRRKGLSLRTYAVIPINPGLGILQWVPHTTTFKTVIEGEGRARFAARSRSLLESKSNAERSAGTAMQAMSEPDSKSKWMVASSEASLVREAWLRSWYAYTEEGSRGDPIRKQFGPAYGALYRAHPDDGEKTWLDVMKYQPTDLLRAALQGMANSPDAVLLMRAHAMRSLSAFNAVSYLISLGDRHLDNFLIDTRTGELVSIDFGAAWGHGTTALPVPELIPIRCTPSILTLAAPLPTPLVLLSMMTSAWSCLQADASHTGSGRLMQQLQLFVMDPTLDWQQTADKRSQVGRSSSEGSPNEESENARALRDLVGSAKGRAKLLGAQLRLRGANPADMLFLDLLQNSNNKGPLCKGRTKVKEAHVMIPRATVSFPSSLAGMRAAVYASHRQQQQQPRTRALNTQPLALTSVEESLLTSALNGPLIGNGDAVLNVGLAGTGMTQCHDPKQQVACILDLATDPNILARQWAGLATWV